MLTSVLTIVLLESKLWLLVLLVRQSELKTTVRGHTDELVSYCGPFAVRYIGVVSQA
jgi:hypothetical protein